LNRDELVQKLVDGYGSWVQTDCENHEGGTARFTKNLYPYDTLFSPIKINKLTIRNRTVMAPMGNC
jgi:2-enoate reductase